MLFPLVLVSLPGFFCSEEQDCLSRLSSTCNDRTIAPLKKSEENQLIFFEVQDMLP
jgi:hypothetical protein